MISRKRTRVPSKEDIMVFDMPVPWTIMGKHLGGIFNDRVNFTAHVNETLIGRFSELNRKSKLTLVKIVILSILVYTLTAL